MSRIVKLPAGYRQVDYIESTGTQYVDTEFVPNQDTRVVMDCELLNFGESWASPFSTRSDSKTTNAFGVYYGKSGQLYDQYASTVKNPTGLSFTGRRIIDKNKNTTNITGIALQSHTYTAFTALCSMCLFIDRKPTESPQYYFVGRTYSCQIYDNGVLVRDYIPCKTTANVAGLYDLVEGKFYGNAGTGAFLYGAPVVLPKGYRRLTYIQSSGTQYVDTGYVPTVNTKIDADIDFLSGNTTFNCVFGVGQTSSNQFVVYRNGSNMVGQVYSTKTYNTSGVTNIGRNRVVLSNSQFTYGAFSTAVTAESFTYTYPLFLFAMNSVGSATLYAYQKLYYCQIYDNGALTRDYVPCITDGGEVGLYDDLNGVFYGNAGTGAFIAGKKIYTEDDITKLEYVESTGSQWVNTEVISKADNFRINIEFAYTSVASGQAILGTQATSGAPYGVIPYLASAGTASLYCASSSKILSISVTAGAKNAWSIEAKAGTAIWQHNGSTATAAYSGTPNQASPYFLFANSHGGNAMQNCQAKIYAAQVYDADFLTRDYYPAKADGEIGLWDACTGVLYTSASDTVLVAGPEIKYTPDTPTDFAISEITDSSVTLAWSGVEDALGYRVYRNALLRAELTETVFTDDITPFEYTGFAVTAFNDLGESDPATLTVNYFPENPVLHLITDRTYDDATRADYLNALWVGGIFTGTTEELAEWFGIVKGAYNAHDFNRVGAALRYIANRMNAQGYIASASVKTDWRDADTPTPAQAADYLAAVRNLRGVIAVLPTTPAVPNDMEDFSHDEANAIEQILIDLDMLLTNISLAWVYSGEIYSGEV